MHGWREVIRSTLDACRTVLQNSKEAYAGANRFARMRAVVLGVLGLDVLGVLVGVTIASSSGGAFDVEAWFERSFPSNLIVVRNKEHEPLRGVTLVLDGRYVLTVETLPSGLEGFEVERDFKNAENERPDSSYRPTALEIRVGDESMSVSVGEHAGAQ